jgi:2-dehydro-3-deoxyglucarate aldolase/4-hydroxy-2-oxoheptanedioate aldolase
MKPNRFIQVVKEGRIPIGTMIWEFASRGVPKILEAADLDFVLIDMEHSTFDSGNVADLLALFDATPIAPFVRVPQRLYHFLARAMDAGALGVMVANVETVDEASEIVNAVKYAPVGHRGVGLGSAHTNFIVPDPVTYFREANENTTIIAMIESPRGVANAEAIAAMPGIDVLWVGHFDLTQTMGIPAQFGHPDFLEAIRRVIAATRKYGKIAGINPRSHEQTDDWVAAGFTAISWANDTAIYRDALSQAAQSLRHRFPRAAGEV